MRFPILLALALVACDPDPGADAGPGDAGTDAGRTYVPEPFAPTEATRAYCQGDDDAIEERITEILADLSQAEKVSLMHGAGVMLVDGTWHVGGVERLGIPGLDMLDGPRGLSSFTGLTGTAFPVGMMRGATWDPALEERVGAAMGRELRASGASVLLAPTINILQHPRWGRAQETYGEDTHHMGEMGVAFIRGVQSEGVIASAKHYAVNSIEDTRHEVDVSIDERTLREIYLPHFRRAVQEAGVGSVMSAYNQVNGLYCDLNTHLLREILKDEWGFAGFVESDWILGTHGDVESVRAGLDIEMPSNAFFRNLRRELAAGAIEEREIDDSVRRILRAQLCFGLDTRDRVRDDPSARETPEHLALAREVATRGIVLLRNEGPVLPLDPSGSFVVLGRTAAIENIGDGGSSSVTPSDVVTALEGIAARAASVTHLEGTTLDAAGEAAVTAADAVLVITGLTEEDEGEADISAGDRDTMELRSEEIALIEAAAALNPSVVVVLEGGSAILVEGWVDGVAAILHAFYPGSEGGPRDRRLALRRREPLGAAAVLGAGGGGGPAALRQRLDVGHLRLPPRLPPPRERGDRAPLPLRLRAHLRRLHLRRAGGGLDHPRARRNPRGPRGRDERRHGPRGRDRAALRHGHRLAGDAGADRSPRVRADRARPGRVGDGRAERAGPRPRLLGRGGERLGGRGDRLRGQRRPERRGPPAERDDRRGVKNPPKFGVCVRVRTGGTPSRR